MGGINGAGGFTPASPDPTTLGATGGTDTTVLGDAVTAVSNAAGEALTTVASTASEAVTSAVSGLYEYVSSYFGGAYGPTPFSEGGETSTAPYGQNRMESNDPMRTTTSVPPAPPGGGNNNGFIPGLTMGESVGVVVGSMVGVGLMVLGALCCYKSCKGGASSRGTPRDIETGGRHNEGYESDESGEGRDIPSVSGAMGEHIDVHGRDNGGYESDSESDEGAGASHSRVEINERSDDGNGRIHWTRTTERSSRIVRTSKSGVGNDAYESDSDDDHRAGRDRPARPKPPKPPKGGPKKPPKAPPPPPPPRPESDDSSGSEPEMMDYGALQFKRGYDA